MLPSIRESRSSSAVKKRKKVSRWKGLERGFFAQNPLSPSFFKPPFSPPARSLQTPQIQSQNQYQWVNTSNVKMKGKPSDDAVEGFQKKPAFQLVYLSNDEDQSVEVKEVEEIDFEEVKMRVEGGDSVFITRRESEKVDASLFETQGAGKDAEKPWYVAHV